VVVLSGAVRPVGSLRRFTPENVTLPTGCRSTLPGGTDESMEGEQRVSDKFRWTKRVRGHCYSSRTPVAREPKRTFKVYVAWPLLRPELPGIPRYETASRWRLLFIKRPEYVPQTGVVVDCNRSNGDADSLLSFYEERIPA